MLRAWRWHFLHPLVLLLVVFGMGGSFFGWWQAERSLDHNNGVLLQENANQASLLLNSYLPYFGTPPTTLANLVTPIGVSASTFDAAAARSSVVKGGGAIALLRNASGHLEVLASAGALDRSFGGSSDATLVRMLKNSHTFVGAGVTQKHRYVTQIYGSGVVPPGFALYVQQPIPTDVVPASGVFDIPDSVFSGIQAAVYVGSPQPRNLVFDTTAHFSTSGPQAVVTVDDDNATLTDHPIADTPGQLVLVLYAKGNLSGSSAARFPFVLLAVGMGAVVVVASMLELALRRRDVAYQVAEDLRMSNEELDHKNTALDLALTRQAEAEQSLRQAQRMEAVGQLAGGIAHDFNNLLHVILSYSSFLADDAAEPEALQADVAEIQTAAERAAELTRQLLIYSRTDVTRAVALEARAIVANTERILRRAVGEDVNLTCAMDDADCTIMADAAEIDQVLMNLTTNARDAMPNGGNLEIEVRRIEGGEDGLLPVPYVRIDVRDDGEGMDEEVAAKAFDPFFTTKDPGRGTGLGLAMVYGIVTRWGGVAAITTAPGAGTTVTLCFPAASPTTEEASGVPDRVCAVGGTETILLVEDEESVLRSTCRMLTSAGYHVVTAPDAMEATNVFARERIDVLVTDVIMPGGVSGKQLADALRHDRPSLPVVFVSGYSAEKIAERGVLPSQTLLVKKPFAPDELLNAVREAIAQYSEAVLIS